MPESEMHQIFHIYLTTRYFAFQYRTLTNFSEIQIIEIIKSGFFHCTLGFYLIICVQEQRQDFFKKGGPPRIASLIAGCLGL